MFLRKFCYQKRQYQNSISDPFVIFDFTKFIETGKVISNFLTISFQIRPLTIDELTKDEEYPALALLSKIPGFLNAIRLTCDSNDDMKFTKNDEKLENWLSNRFNLLVSALKNYNGVSESIRSSGKDCRLHLSFSNFRF